MLTSSQPNDQSHPFHSSESSPFASFFGMRQVLPQNLPHDVEFLSLNPAAQVKMIVYGKGFLSMLASLIDTKVVD